jgi:hypothetical protein
MAERPMATVMQQGSDYRDFGTFRVEDLADAGNFPLDDLSQAARRVKDADGVGETGMCGTREYEFGNAELPDTSQALEFERIEKLPGELIK